MAGTKGTTPKCRMGMISATGCRPAVSSSAPRANYGSEAGDGAVRRGRLVGEEQMVWCDRTGDLPIGVGRVKRIAVELRRLGYGLLLPLRGGLVVRGHLFRRQKRNGEFRGLRFVASPSRFERRRTQSMVISANARSAAPRAGRVRIRIWSRMGVKRRKGSRSAAFPGLPLYVT